MASGITLVADISQATGISSGFGAISNGSGISGNAPSTGPTFFLTTDAGVKLTDDAGANRLTTQ